MNIYYIRSGDYYIPDLTLPEETRPIGKWGVNAPGLYEGITEALKASDPMAWVQRMNNIHARAEEIVREELIYA